MIATMKSQFRASNAMTTILVTQPKIVKISINGKNLQNGKYLMTPISIPLKPGKNEIRVSREGYRSHIATVEKIIDEKLNIGEITLAKKPQIETLSLEVTGDKIANPYYVEVNRGFFHGETPLIGTDLPLRGYHVLDIYPNGNAQGPRHRCSFSLAGPGTKSQISIDKVRIKISTTPDGKIVVAGCHLESEGAN